MKLKKMLWPTLINLLPILIGLVFYNRLQDTVPIIHIQWDTNDEKYIYASKLFAALFLPLLLTFLNYILYFSLNYVKNNIKDISPNLVKWLIWVIPVTGLFIQPLLFKESYGQYLSDSVITIGIVGLIMIVLGNYMPKITQNLIIGYRLPTTLTDSVNWQKTNRLGGIMLVLTGLIFCITAIFSYWYQSLLVVAAVTALIFIFVIPVIYSLTLFKKKRVDEK